MDELLKPIRVIDIWETLNSERGGFHFVRPRDWNFHVLSHTWSAIVRQMSERIGRCIGACVGEDQDAYSIAFQSEDFRQAEPCYPHLMEIFQLLHADGVEYVWFDALCINQLQDLSKGSYVLSHGFGKENGLWGDSSGALPRWFTRVWTFQEFLLPRQVSFLVEGGVDHRFMAIIEKLIKAKGKSGLCKCFLSMPSSELNDFFFRNLEEDDLDWMGGFELRNPHWKSIEQLIDERSPYKSACQQEDENIWTVGPTCYKYLDVCCKTNTDSNKMYRRDLVQEKKFGPAKAEVLWETKRDEEGKANIPSETTICPSCGSRPMIRRVKIKPEQRQTSYFFDREVYLALMQCHSRLLEIGSKMNKPSWGIQVLRGLYCALATEGNWRPCHVICEVGWRDCTNEEDRVLALLGLLGLKLKKLRTGKPLPEQILELAKVGGSAMLVELCTVNQKGSALPHMSWAPDFHGHNEKLEHASRPKEVYMNVENLHAHGSLQVKARVMHGRVVPKKTSVGTAHKAPDYSLMLENADGRHERLYIPLLTMRTEYYANQDKPMHLFHFEFSYNGMKEAGSFEVPIQALTHGNQHTRVSFPVCLVLLGKDEVERKLLLICLPAQEHSAHNKELHKIGSMSLDKGVLVSLHNILDSGRLQDCVIGGFGDDLTQYITTTHTQPKLGLQCVS